MAAPKVTVKNVNGYTTAMGNRGVSVKTISWDNGNYVSGPAGGLLINIASFGLRGFDIVLAGISGLGNYDVEAQVPAGAPKQVRLRLMVAATGAEVGNGVALTPDSIQVLAIGG